MLLPSNLNITKIINSNVVVMIIVFSVVYLNTQVMFRFEGSSRNKHLQHDHKQFSSVSALPQ